MRFANRIVTMLMFLSSSGFTTVLHRCTMSDSGCCDASSACCTSMCRDEEMPSLPGPSVSDGFQCHHDLLVGGGNEVQGLLEKEGRAQPAMPYASVVHLLPAGDAAFSIFTNILLNANAEDIPPLPVERYILTATLLI